jgi:uncharacterized SAM-binding protein YcdF (DUF218 family)
MESNVDRLAKILWNYHRLNQKINKSDIIWGLGCSYLEVAEKTSQLYLEGFAPLIIYTGGYGKITSGKFKETEAQTFKNISEKMGVPVKNILIEDRSTNTLESIANVKPIFKDRFPNLKSIIVVTKPYMERRAFATFSKQFPGQVIYVTSPSIKFEQFTNKLVDKGLTINLMVGDLQRIIEYADISLVPQIIPPSVNDAYHQLISLGYTQQLLNQEILEKTKR